MTPKRILKLKTNFLAPAWHISRIGYLLYWLAQNFCTHCNGILTYGHGSLILQPSPINILAQPVAYQLQQMSSSCSGVPSSEDVNGTARHSNHISNTIVTYHEPSSDQFHPDLCSICHHKINGLLRNLWILHPFFKNHQAFFRCCVIVRILLLSSYCMFPLWIWHKLLKHGPMGGIKPLSYHRCTACAIYITCPTLKQC